MYGPHTNAVNSVSIYSKKELRNKAANMSKKNTITITTLQNKKNPVIQFKFTPNFTFMVQILPCLQDKH